MGWGGGEEWGSQAYLLAIDVGADDNRPTLQAKTKRFFMCLLQVVSLFLEIR